MDRDTLSQYGWIVITIIILALLIGMATPFATSVRTSIETTVNEFKTQLAATMNNFTGSSSDDDDSGGSGGSGEAVTPKVQTPEVVVDGDMLTITDTSGKADRYLIYSGAVLVGNVVSTGTNTKFSLDGLDVGTHTLHVVARADGMNDSDKSTVYYTKLDTLQSPALTIENETLVIVDSTQKAETYDVYIGDTLLKTVTAVHPETTVDLSTLEVGSHQVSVVAKATDMNESNKVTTSYTKLATLNTPTLSVSGDVLSITDDSGKAEGYDIYDGDTLVTTLTKSGTTTTYDISGLAVGTHSIGVVAKASGMKDSAKVTTSYTKSATLNTPTLSIDDETLTITDASGKAEKYAIYDGSNLITTVTSTGTVTTVDLSGFTVGTHTVGVIAKANNMNDSAKVNINYEKLGTVSTPTLTVNDETLVITDAAGEAETYDIYDATTWIATVPSTGTTTNYDLSGLSVGSHTINVVAKANNMKDSSKATVAFKKLATLATPILTVDDETLKITDSTSKTESYSVYDGETLIGTVVATNPTTSYDLSGLDVGTHTIKVVAHATEMKDSAEASATFKKLATLDTPSLAVDNETLVITDSSTRAEKFEIYDGNTLIATVTSTGTETEYSVSTLSAGTHTISVIAKATDMKDSNKVSTEFTMRETVDTPSVTVNDETLVITDNSGKAKTYDVYDGTTLIKTVASAGTTTEIDLSGLSVGTHTINVVAKADDMKDSTKATTTFTKLDTVNTPTVTVNNETLVITDNSGEADVYEVYDGTNLIDTVTSNGTTTEVDLSGLSIGTHAIKVIAKADGKKDAESVTVTFMKLDTVDDPALSVNNETLVITDTVGKADKYEIYDGNNLIATITSAGETTEYDLSDLSVGTHTIGVIGKADNMKDGAKVTTSFTKLATVSTPTLSIVDDVLNIKNTANDADEYEIYNGTTLITTVTSAGVTTTYELYDLPAGTYELAVIGKADNCHNSEKATINHTVADYSGYKPDATLDFKTLTLNHDNDADEYVISINGTEYQTVTSLGAGNSSEYTLDIQFGDVVSVVGYRHDKQIGIATELNANNSDIAIESLVFNTDLTELTVTLTTWDDYYAVSTVKLKRFIDGEDPFSLNGTFITKSTRHTFTADEISDGSEISFQLILDGILVDEKAIVIPQASAPTLSINDETLVITGDAEQYAIYDGDTLLATVTSAGATTEYDLSSLAVGTHTIKVIAKADNAKDSAAVTTSFTKLATVSTPVLSIKSDVLIITNNSNDAEVYGIYNGATLITTVTSAGVTTQYDLSELPAGTYELVVVGKADGKTDSEKATIAYTVEETIELSAGLYDANDNLLADWDTLVNTYGLDVTGIYAFNFTTATTSPYYILNNYDELSTGAQLIIGEGVTSIGNYAFTACSGLTSVTIPNGVTSIGIQAFGDCTSLTSIIIGEGVASIGNYAFRSCTSLINVTIPDSVTSIGSSILDACTNLESIVVSSENTVYHSANNCLIKTATKTLIAGCKNSVIPDDGSVTSIQGIAFSRCSGLTSVMIPEGVTIIGFSAFYGCTGLTSVTISDSVTSIGDSAFYNCSSLTSVTIPDSVTSIENNAFSNCTSLNNVVLPAGLTKIGDQAFLTCSSLNNLEFKGDSTAWASVSKGSSWKNGTKLSKVVCSDKQVAI